MSIKMRILELVTWLIDNSIEFTFTEETVTIKLKDVELNIEFGCKGFAIGHFKGEEKAFSDLGDIILFIKEKSDPDTKITKPVCKLIGEDGNIYNLLGIASKVLKKHDKEEDAKLMKSRVFSSGSYDEALSIIGEYVEIV